MKKKQEIISGKVNGNGTEIDFLQSEMSKKLANEKFYKISMNGSCGYDGMNTENFSKIKICDANKAYQAIISQTYMNGMKLNEDTFMIQHSPKSYHYTTCIQESLWCLDNAKFWYLTFFYDFMNECLDMERIHFIEGDTDSMYIAIAGNPIESPEQLFNHVIKNKEFYCSCT